MKISICSTWFKNRKLEEVIGLAGSYGFDGIEIWSGHIDNFIEREGNIEKLIMLLEQNKLTVPCIAAYFEFTGSGQEEANSFKEAQRSAEYAKKLGAGVIRTFLGYIPSREMTEEKWKKCFNALKDICSLDRNIQFALETHENHPTDSVDSILYILKNTGERNLKVLFDGFNLHEQGYDQMDALKQLYENVVHVHMKNYHLDKITGNLIPTSINAGDADNERLINFLEEMDYNGFMSLEYFIEDYNEIIWESIEYIKKRI